MGTVIVSGADVIAPTMLLEQSSDRAAQTIVHPIIGASTPDVTLRAAAARSGRLLLGWQGEGSEGDSRAAERLLGEARVFSVVSDERETLALSFVVVGNITRALEDQSRDAWTVAVDYQEVAA